MPLADRLTARLYSRLGAGCALNAHVQSIVALPDHDSLTGGIERDLRETRQAGGKGLGRAGDASGSRRARLDQTIPPPNYLSRAIGAECDLRVVRMAAPAETPWIGPSVPVADRVRAMICSVSNPRDQTISASPSSSTATCGV